jgi:hypothetical protein
VALASLTRVHVLIAGCLLAALGALAFVAMSARPSEQGAVLSQLERPAVSPVVAVGPGPVHTVLTAGSYGLAISLTPNRATQPAAVTVQLRQHGAALPGATMSVTYGMPSMNMPAVLTTDLRSLGGGAYASHQPEMAMAGQWTLHFTVRPPHAAAFSVTLADRMIG